MGKIQVQGIRCYAHHGCMPEETQIGAEFLVHVTIETDLSPSAETDDLTDTIDYVDINRIVKEEMAVPSKLIEHVAGRIIKRLKSDLNGVEKTVVEVVKINPPIHGDVDFVSVTLDSEGKI